MAEKLPEVGDQVIFKGRMLTVTQVETKTATCEDAEARIRRESAKKRFTVLREEQVQLTSEQVARHTSRS